MKITVTAVIILFINSIVFSQTYQGPAQGGISKGVVVSTDNFAKASPVQAPEEKKVRNKFKYIEKDRFIGDENALEKANINYFEDPSLSSPSEVSDAQLLSSWSGMEQTNSIPPDPYIAAGPAHVITTVNSRFAIWDKSGNLLEDIEADAWFNTAFPGADCFDPKVIYDHFDKRWVMVWLHQDDNTKEAFYLVSVSDDSIPTGTWYNWALPSYTNGNDSTTTWADYQGVGFDDQAVYITSNQWEFEGSFQYLKIRILPKASLYNSAGNAVSWFDIWDLTYPHNTERVFTLRPSITYTAGGSYNLLHAPGGSSNFMTLYQISNPTTNPGITGVNIEVTRYNTAANANQLGGSSIRDTIIHLESGGTALRHEVIFRDGYIWAVHGSRNPTSANYSSLHYVKINVSTGTAEEDFFFGAGGFWHFYPTLAVDKDHNVAITYSRSGDLEYAGAYYISRLKEDEPGFTGSQVLQSGKGNYVKDFDSGRNRWGDYNGIWLDPVDQNNFWLFTEYAAGTNTWGTWVGELRLVPFTGVYMNTSISTLDFRTVEVNTASPAIDVQISNLGDQDLVISEFQSAGGPFKLVSDLSFPLTIGSNQSVTASFSFSPDVPGNFTEDINIISNNPSPFILKMKGTGYEMKAAEENTFYASSGSVNNGNILKVDPSSGQGITVGPSLYTEVKSIAVQPKSNIIFGIVTNVQPALLVRVNAESGDAYVKNSYPLTNINSIAFDTTGNLYAALRTGEIYRLDINSGEYTQQCSVKALISAIAFNPLNNELWGTVYQPLGSNKDKIFKINLATGDTTNVGRTSLSNSMNHALAFDRNGTLFAVIGPTTGEDTLVFIDKNTGAGARIGSIGFNNITGLAFAANIVTSTGRTPAGVIPNDFTLNQNYPNPFNPSTTIEYGLPVNARVKLNIYNLLGELVAQLVDNEQSPGFYSVTWDAQNLSSGIYFYELKASGSGSNSFTQLKKMILIK